MVDPSKNHGSPGNRETTLEPGVHYVCQRCTACCKWPGDVRLEDEEIPRIAAFLEMTEPDFLDRFTRLRTNRQGLSLIEKENHECIMLDGNSCRIHPVKPEQCAGFPNKWNFPRLAASLRGDSGAGRVGVIGFISKGICGEGKEFSLQGAGQGKERRFFRALRVPLRLSGSTDDEAGER